MKPITLLMAVLILGLGIIAGRVMSDRFFSPVIAGKVIELRTTIPLPTLQTIVGNASTDEEAYQRVVSYYEQNRAFFLDCGMRTMSSACAPCT